MENSNININLSSLEKNILLNNNNFIKVNGSYSKFTLDNIHLYNLDYVLKDIGIDKSLYKNNDIYILKNQIIILSKNLELYLNFLLKKINNEQYNKDINNHNYYLKTIKSINKNMNTLINDSYITLNIYDLLLILTILETYMYVLYMIQQKIILYTKNINLVFDNDLYKKELDNLYKENQLLKEELTKYQSNN